MTSNKIKLIVGLANPGTEYENTRHNAGAWFVETLCQREKLTLSIEKKFHGKISKLPGLDCHLMIPTTYMNNSGLAVASIAQFYKINPEEILIVHDELDLSAGDIKLNFNRGAAGHNGLRSIIDALQGSQAFYRLRIGIGRPTRGETVDYVLSAPSKLEREKIDNSIADAIEILPLLLVGDIDKAMQQLHTKDLD